ncbi:hypothetical protein [Marinobacterium arenosum]|uniref:hypothetical protein n=1 Tax=Marinobacterium arenosum TaxID=2862496 RepID=UPI001C95558A|nr:hypothetical protein [Marinobacterium arenosum]MBY4678894.1 hypothetical protein [Marinobacterium arenosum]
MRDVRSPEAMFEADLLWREIQLGDLLVLESDLEQDGQPVLKAGQRYEVLAKLSGASGQQQFVVQSDLTNQTVSVYPAQICSYESAEQPVHHA